MAVASKPERTIIILTLFISLFIWLFLFIFGNSSIVYIDQFKNNNKMNDKLTRVFIKLNNPIKFKWSYFSQGLVKLKYVNVANLSLILTHTLFAIIAGIFLINGPFNLGMENTSFQNKVLSVTLSFIVIDLIAMAALRNTRKDFIIHHLICMAALSYSLLTNRSGWELGLSIAIGELGPFFYIENLAKKLHIKSKKFYHSFKEFI